MCSGSPTPPSSTLHFGFSTGLSHGGGALRPPMTGLNRCNDPKARRRRNHHVISKSIPWPKGCFPPKRSEP
jgi:hypothetical protein